MLDGAQQQQQQNTINHHQSAENSCNTKDNEMTSRSTFCAEKAIETLFPDWTLFRNRKSEREKCLNISIM
jgi:hypothetical protein